MKNTLTNLTTAVLITVCFAATFTGLGVWLFRTYSVSPTFPYYYNLLLHTKDAAYALWGYFDGVHYLRLIENGYVDTGTQAFFPLYPLLSSWVYRLFGLTPYVSGLIVSWTSLALSLFVLWRLYPGQKLLQTLVLLLFPTSFFFLGIYTESLFLLLSLSFFLFLQKDRYFLAALTAALASSTRLVGVFLGFVLVWRLYRRDRFSHPLRLLSLSVLSLTGLTLYCSFLWRQFGDPLMFLHVQAMFGANRSGSELILLPQVLYRYFRMVMTVDPHTFLYQRIWFELCFFLGGIWLWFRNRRSTGSEINLYVLLSLLLPTLTGTLSSIPRYLLVLLPFLLPRHPKHLTITLYLLLSTFLLLYLFTHFTRGTFIA